LTATQTKTSTLVSDLTTLRDTRDRITLLQDEAVLFLLSSMEDTRQQFQFGMSFVCGKFSKASLLIVFFYDFLSR
jgi:hypothetical protein